MNSLTVNLHLLMVSFYRPAGRAHPHRHRGRARSPPTATPCAARPASTASTRTTRWSGCGRAPARTPCAPRTCRLPGRRGRHGRAGAARRGQLPHRRADGHPGDHRGRARGAGAVVGWDLAHAAGNVPLRAARLGRRLRRLVLVQVPELRPGRAGRRLRARAAPRRRRPAAVRGLVEHRGGDPVRDDAGVPAAGHRRRPGRSPTRRSSRWARCAPRWSSSTRSACDALRERSLRLTGYLETLLDEVTAGPAAARGHPARPGAARLPAVACASTGQRANELAQRLRYEHGVIADAREPDIVRFAPVPLYSTYHDCWRAARRAGRDGGG